MVIMAAFGAAAPSAVAGFGGGVLVLPVFAAIFGTRGAVAIMTVTQPASNGSRVWFNRPRSSGVWWASSALRLVFESW
ncbi:hypothetical protein [Streptomyces sp. 8N616]|uniref:hypothetical protein n=1 Tax=Streptomyces sp. 8N616 TaxID=3457414 RepID=UPI003FD4F502